MSDVFWKTYLPGTHSNVEHRTRDAAETAAEKQAKVYGAPVYVLRAVTVCREQDNHFNWQKL